MKRNLLLNILIVFCVSLLSWNTDSFSIGASEPTFILSSSDSQRAFQLNSDDHDSIYPYEGEISVPRNTSISSRTRTNAQVRRPASSVLSGKFAILKNGRIQNNNIDDIFKTSLERFPSGLKESANWLIHLGKLII